MRDGMRGDVVVAIGGLVVLVAVVGAGLLLFGGDDDADGPAAAASSFVQAWSAGDGDSLRRLVVDPATLDAIDPVEVGDDLGATQTDITLGVVDEDGDRARARFTAVLTLGELGQVEWSGQLPLADVDDVGWRVEWSEAALHPALAAAGSIRRTTTWPERAPILGVGDQTIAGPVETILVGIEPQGFDRAASIPVLAESLGLDPAAIEAALDGPGVEPHHFVQIAELRPEEYEPVRPVVHPIPGVKFRRTTARGGPTDGFARHVVGRYGEITAERLEELGPPYRVGDRVGLDGLEARFERQLAGLPAVDVHVVDAAGEVVTVLASFPGAPAEPVRTTLDPSVQTAAEAALAETTVPAALVAVEAATGAIRAAVSRPLDEAFNRAIGGSYPPGSTFKVVTAYSLLASGVTPSTPADCPPEYEVDGRRFRNFEGGASGRVPFSQAFAESCNTAIIGAAEQLAEGALGDASEVFGFGLDYSVGPTTLGGSFPAPETPVERAAAAIGQGRVTASPLHMATVAAAVLDGTWRTPSLLVSDAGGGETRVLDAGIQEQVAALMRLVVTEGSGRAANIAGLDVLGKTGTAEFGEGDPPPTHAWFVAAADGLGIAVVLEGGGAGGRDAAPVAARFLEALAA